MTRSNTFQAILTRHKTTTIFIGLVRNKNAAVMFSIFLTSQSISTISVCSSTNSPFPPARNTFTKQALQAFGTGHSLVFTTFTSSHNIHTASSYFPYRIQVWLSAQTPALNPHCWPFHNNNLHFPYHKWTHFDPSYNHHPKSHYARHRQQNAYHYKSVHTDTFTNNIAKILCPTEVWFDNDVPSRIDTISRFSASIQPNRTRATHRNLSFTST